ncbi:MAG: phosphatidate cytidylyltransferase [Clostridia bacterium]|nr:phosphatidate cytidylyltransferase [Clostridia bacterium]
MKLLIPVTAEGLDFGALGVDVLFWAIAVIGAFELTRAFGERKKTTDGNGNTVIEGGISKAQRWVAIVTCALLIPAFVVTKMLTIRAGNATDAGGMALIVLLSIGSLGAMIIASLTVFDHEMSDLKSTAFAEFTLLYCGALVCVGPNVNHLKSNSEIAILLLFTIVPFVDTCAFLFGKLFGKLLPYKLAPHTSPNKTVIGAVGGLIGGAGAGVVTWLISEFTAVAPFGYAGSVHPVAFLIPVALLTAILSQLGDLFESAIKRGCGIKDMGRLLPGHGGVLDRFDSMLFATVAIVVCFMWIG